MTDCIRVLHVFGTLGHGGAESRIIDLYRHMDRDRVQFDFVVHYEAEETGKNCPSSQELLSIRHADYFDEQVRALGGNIYAVPRFKGLNLADYQKAWGNLFEENKNTWHAVQGHMTSTAAIYLPIAKKAGIPLTVAHARSAG
ncbi:MAG: glycosyltransferase family 1 protein, partial [Lachnospiraceae bacterium]|nr:glycosyltransferase family 1 protein [Lachnospiraceae bacterium]